MVTSNTTAVRYDAATPALVITALSVTDPAVTTEALRWGHGVRGAAESASEVEDRDLSAFAEQALAVGAAAIAAAGGTQDAFNLEQLVQDVGTRTTEAATRAADSTTKVVDEASKAMHEASIQATKALAEAGETARTSFARSVAEAKGQLQEQVAQLFGGEDPQLMAKLDALLARFESNLVQRTDTQTASLFTAATKALNPDDPTSPLARHQAQLTLQHTELASSLHKQNAQIVQSLDELRTTITVQRAAAEAKADLASVTPLKGVTYEDKLNALFDGIAAGLGDEFAVSRNTVGVISRCKKGDGTLTIMGGPARVVVEMTHSSGREWGPYLDEAERNRQAAASLGLVPTSELNGHESIRVLGPRRIVMAFDPDTDDPSLLRTVIQLLRVSAIAASSRRDDGSAQVAAERIAQALQELPRVERIRKTASAIRQGADKIDGEAVHLDTQLNRLLLQAQTSLADVTSAAADGGDAAPSSGVA